MTEGWVECPNCAYPNLPASTDCVRCRQPLEHEVQQGWEVASNWRRLGAALVDIFIMGIVVIGVLVGAIWLGSAASTDLVTTRTAIAILGLLPAYKGLSGLLWRATPGKWLLGLRVIAQNGQRLPGGRAFAREVLYAYLAWTPVLNVLWLILLAIDPRGQGWHDKAARSCVVNVR